MSSDQSDRCVPDAWLQPLISRLDWLMLLAAGALLMAAGCGRADGPQRHSASGRVLLNGTPLPDGMIRFIPTGPAGGPAASARVTSGLFSLTEENGPVAVPQRVEIEATAFQNFEIDDESAFAASFAQSGTSPLAMNPVPARYNAQSELTAEIAAGSNDDLLFELRSDP